MASPAPTSLPSGPVLTAFSIPQPQSGPFAIAVGPDGNLWLTESVGEAIARVTPNGNVREFPVPGSSQRGDLLFGITAGPANTLWVADATAGSVLESTISGTMRSVFVGSPSTSGPSDLVPDEFGNLWVADGIANAIEQIVPSGGATSFPLPVRNAEPYWIVHADGDQWFTEEPGKIGRFDGAGHLVAEYPTPHYPNAKLLGITSTRGTIWYADAADDVIGEVDDGGMVREFPLPAPSGERAGPFFLTGDDVGNVWFTYLSESGDADAIGRLDGAGRVTMLTLPFSAAPSGITFGPDRNIWFLEAGSNQVVRMEHLSAFGTRNVTRVDERGRGDRRFVTSWLAEIRPRERAR
ncbi:MAG: hypothetical protein ABI346_05580 [Candidatus Baltobacteraceae bacterium]